VEAAGVLEVGEGEVELVVLGTGPKASGEAIPELVLGRQLFFRRRWLVAEAELRLELHLFQLLLHVLSYARLAFGPVVRNLDLDILFPIPLYAVVVHSEVAQVHRALLLGVVASVAHVPFLVLLLVVRLHGLHINRVLGT
jgi:hypothetical protein